MSVADVQLQSLAAPITGEDSEMQSRAPEKDA